jgi:hypothetical protein
MDRTVYKIVNVLWVRTHHLTAVYATAQALNDFNFHYLIISHFYPILFYSIVQK